MTLAVHRLALRPTKAQEAYFVQGCGAARFAYNWGLTEWQRMHRTGEKPGWMEVRKRFNRVKAHAFPWVRQVTKSASAKAFRCLGDAFARFFAKKGGFPKHKKKGRCRESFTAGEEDIFVDGCRVKLPVIGWVRTRQPVRFSGPIKRATVSRTAGRWFVSLLIDTPDIKPVPAKAKRAAAGVDLGVKAMATVATGAGFESMAGPKPLARLLGKLRRLSRSLTRKKKGSANRRKAADRLAKLHSRIANVRADALHKLTTQLAKGYRAVGIEDLNVRGMMANGHLARSVGDMGFGEFRRQMGYKCRWYGTSLVVADRFYPSSKTCPDCGARNDGLTLGDRFWTCPGCGAWLDRDAAAAENLRGYAVGHTASACGAGSAGRKRKPLAKLPASKQEQPATSAG